MKHIALVVFFSILMLVPAAIFPPPQASATIEDNLYKFDEGFYEKIQEMQNQQIDGVTGASDDTHTVLVITDDAQEDITEQALEDLGATNIFKSNELDFLIADVPINNVTILANYDFIYKLGDGEETLDFQNVQGAVHTTGMNMAQAKTVVNADDISSSSPSYPYTGRGVTVGLIDSLVDFTHPDLQNKKAGKIVCNGQVCDLPLMNDGSHGTGIAGIIASDSTDNLRDGIAPDSKIFSIEPKVTTIVESRTSKAAFARALDELVNNNDITIALSSRAGTPNGCNDYSALTIVTLSNKSILTSF